jgi:RHS repeat-associated protein
MTRLIHAEIIAASIALFAMEAIPLHAQTPPAEYLPMGPYTNDFSAPMPNWWFYGMPSHYFDSATATQGLINLSPYVYSNDYASATEGLVHHFAAHAVYCLDELFWILGGVSFYAPDDYWCYYGSLESLFVGMGDVATQEYAVGIADSLWSRTWSIGGDLTVPWDWGAPGGASPVNIGQLKNAFSFNLEDIDGDSILDSYEHREFGSLDFVEDIFDDPGGDGLCLLAEIQIGLDPLAGPAALASTTNNTAEVCLFPSFETESSSVDDIVYERTFQIRRTGSWQEYFLIRNDIWRETIRLDILYNDATNAFHSVGDVFGPGSTNTVVRLPLVSPNQTNLTIRIVTSVDMYDTYRGFFSCPSLSLVSWVPKVDFPTTVRAAVDGRRYCAAVPDGVSRLEIPFSVDWSDPPDGSNPTEDWRAEGERAFPLVLSGGVGIAADTNNVAGLPTGGTMLPESAGVYELVPLGPLPASDAANAEGDESLLVVSPRLSWPGTGRGRASWLDYDPVTGVYSRRTAYPLDSACLQNAWHFDDDRYCDHGQQPTLDLGDSELDDILGHSFAPVSDTPPTSRCTVTLGGSNIWEGVVSHYCPDAMWPDDGGEPGGDCDCECDCGGLGVDGDSVGSCEFRLALGFPLLDTVSGFLWFRSEEIPFATPAMLSLMVRKGASVTCESNNPGGAISHIRCLDPRGRDITVAQIDNGLRLTVSNSACTYLDHSWEITNPGYSLSRLRVLKISRLGNPLSDKTYESFPTTPPDNIFTNDSQAWRITDNLTGLVETRIVSDGLNDPSCRARWIEEARTDAASGKVYSYSQSRSSILGEGVHAVLREINRVERTWDAAHPRETFATYWDVPANRFLHGKTRLAYGDRPWTYRAYDALGRETLRLSQLDGSPCPASELETLRPETLTAAVSAIPATTSFSATVTDYAPLDGDSDDDLDASLPRTIAEYEVRNGTTLPASRTWTVYNRDGEDDDWGFPVLSVRTERAATPAAAFGDAGNAVSTEVSYDIRDGWTRQRYPLLDGQPVESTTEDGVTTRYLTDEDELTVKVCGKWMTPSGRTLIQTETDMPLPGRAPDPSRPQRIRCLDMLRGTELMSGSSLQIGSYFHYFDFRYNLYDDQDRLRATFFPDGSSTTNAYSCCRLLWSRDRDGRKTVRSALTGEDRLYYANLEPSIANYPHFGSYGPHAEDLTYWYKTVYQTFRITQHFMDAVGRETNTVTSTIRYESDHNPSSRTFTTSDPYAWRSNATVSYPDGVSGHSLSTDARGLVTEFFSRDFPDRTETVTVTYPRGAPSSPFSTNTVVSYRNGAHVSERRWDGCWTRTTESSFRDALGRRTTLSVTEASDLDGPVTNSLSVSDFLGRAILAETPLSSVSYVYDGATSRVVSETDSKSGVTTLHHYDAYGEPTGSTRLGVTSLTSTTYVLDHGDFWRVTTSVVSNGVKTASSAETRERLTGLSNALRSETISLDYGVTNAVTRSSFDDDVLTVTTVSPTRGTNVSEYVCGVPGVVHDASGYHLYCYDPYGRLFHTLRILPGTTAQRSILLTMRNDAGDVIREDVVDKRQGYYHFYSTYHGYDCRGNRIATTNALGGVERRAYDALGRPVALWGSAARPTLYSYDTQGRRTSLSTTRDPTANAVLSTLQPFDLSTCRTAIPWDDTEWRFDPATGLCLNKVYPDGTTVTNTYTPDGLLASRRNAADHDELFTYDANRRLVRRRCGDDSIFGYDAFGNRVHEEYDYLVSDLWRDDRGAVTNEYHESPATTISTSYDDYGRMVSRTTRGRTVRYAYAHDGQLATVSNETFRVDYLYTPDRLDAGYVITTTGGVQIARYVSRDYWRRHLVTVITNSVTPILHSPFSILHSYSYDALGRPVSRNGDDFGYNARSEVAWTTIGGVDAEYVYDPAGNRTNTVWDNAATVYAANGLNQYGTVTSGGVTDNYTYNRWGALTDTRPFSYGYYDNLLCSLYTNRTLGQSRVCYYEYDALKRRRTKDSTPRNAPHRYHYYVYSGWSLQVEDIFTGTDYWNPSETTYYVWGKDLSGTLDGAGGVGGLLATEVGGVWYFPLYDNNGNVTDYVSETGEVVASYAYDAFGRTIAQSGAMADMFPFRFSTKYYDAESGLYYYGYRYYSPDLGRWLTRDPIEEDGGDNLYAFCGNNGVDRYDSLGADWHVTRRHLSFAEAKRDDVYKDTIDKLSQEIDLDSAEAMQWARKDMSGSQFVSMKELNRACRVYIPNRISLVLPVVPEITYGQAFIPIFGQYKASRTLNMISMRNRLREISEMYYNRGFSIESLDYWIENDSNSIKYKDNNSRKWPTFGFIIGGHGSVGSIAVNDSSGDNYESIGISKTKRGYALGMLYVFGCYAGAGDWKSQAAPNAYIFVSPSWRPTVRLEMPTPRFPSK